MKRKILDVRKISQLPMYCGVACLNMILDYYGYSTDQRRLVGCFPHPEKIAQRGTPCSELYEAARYFARKEGFKAKQRNRMRLRTIVDLIDDEIPIISLQKWSRNSETTHYRVIKGYNLDPDYIYINDPASSSINGFSYETFCELSLMSDGGFFSRTIQNYGIMICPR